MAQLSDLTKKLTMLHKSLYTFVSLNMKSRLANIINRQCLKEEYRLAFILNSNSVSGTGSKVYYSGTSHANKLHSQVRLPSQVVLANIFMILGCRSSVILPQDTVRRVHTSSLAVKSYHSAKPSKRNHLPASLKLNKTKSVVDTNKINNLNHETNESPEEKTELHCASISSTAEQMVLETDEDVTKLSELIISRAKSVDIMVLSEPQKQVEGVILGLHHLGLEPSDILSLLSTHPTFLINQRQLLPNIDLLFSLGLDVHQVKEVMRQFPGLVKVTAGQISDIADALRDGSFREKSLAKVIAGNPSIFLLTKASVYHRLMKLRELFKSSDVVTVVVNSPGVLTMDWDDMQALFDYVFHDMQITQKQMVYASLFSHPLQRVKRRHAFLVRAGLFDMSKRKEGEKSPNARLDQIVDTSDEEFCAKFGKFAVQEYRTFCKLYEKENHEQEDSDDE